MKSAVTISLVAEVKDGPFIFSSGLADGFRCAELLGFDAVEIFPGSAEELDARAIHQLCAEHKLEIAAIGTGAGWVKHRLRLTDPDVTVRRQAVAFIAAIVDVAGEIGAPAILGSMQGHWGGTVSRTQALAWLAEALEEFGPRARTYGVPFLYEFLNRYETNLCNRVADSLDFLSTLRTQNVKLLCDLFHMNIEEADIGAALELAGPAIGHIHFADSNRQAVGLGHTKMAPVMAALRGSGYAGYLSAEAFAQPTPQAAAEQTINSFRALTTTV
jgi:sugar phosphate isomerase/epimerase